MLWTSPTSAKIIDTKEEAKLNNETSIIKIGRVALGNLTLTYSATEGSEEKSKPEEESKPEPKQ